MHNTENINSLLKAKKIIFRLLKVRLRSEKELWDRLKQREIPDNIIGEAVRYFKNIDLVDDQKFARGWISSRLIKPFGLNRIKYELKNKGVSEDIICKEIKNIEKTFCEDDTAVALAKKQSLKYKKTKKTLIKQRVYGYLARRGFSSYSISKAIREL